MVEPFVISVASNLVSKLGECLFAPIGRQFGYVLCYKSYIKELEKGIGDLKNEMERVQWSVNEAEYDGKSIFPNVKDWLESVKTEREEATKLSEHIKNAKNASFRGWVSNPLVRHPIGRKVKKKTQVIKGLIEESKTGNFLKVSHEDTPTGILKGTTSAARSVDQKEHVLESRVSIREDVLNAIANDKICVIGVWGAGGVGKTKLLDDVERRVREDNLFDVVARADVSPDHDIRRIQGEIAYALGLTIINEETTLGRACRLHNRLARDSGKILIILDDLWKKLELKEVGIPYEDDNKVKGCKLLLTSRDRTVLTEMNADQEILIRMLEGEEARKLFERTVGDKVKEPQFEPWVDKAVKCCGGLPLLIVSLAKKLKSEKSPDAWEDPLTKIEGSVVRSLVEQNYKDLKEERIKLLFLVCALASGRILLRNSLVYYMGLGLFNNLIRGDELGTIEKARYWLIMDLNRLRDSSLLLDSDDMEWVKIHDQFVEVANSITSSKWKALVGRSNCGFKTWTQDELRKCTAISSHNVGIDKLPENLSYPNLKILLLFEDNSSLKIPEAFFKSMKKLQVLNLTGLAFTSLPSSIEFLENLKSLCLCSCHLEDVILLGKLKGLQFLSFSCSTITRLPKEIGGLTELRFLDLTGCAGLKFIEPGVLRNLINLEELYMEDSFDQWETECEPPQSNASLAELENMEKLSTLYIAIPRLASLSGDLPIGKLKNYKIQTGDIWNWLGEYKESRTLKLKVDSGYILEEWVLKCLQMTQDLHLDGLQKGYNSIHDLCDKGFEELKHLHVQNSPSFQYVVQSTSPAFVSLESLFLHNLNRLQKICLSYLASESFRKLKYLEVDGCGGIKRLFPLSMMRIFLQLEEIKISGCHLMEHIVADVEAEEDGDELAYEDGDELEYEDGDELSKSKEIRNSQFPSDVSNLKFLKVEDCTLILSIIPSNLLINLQNLEVITVERCNSIQEIFNLEGLTTCGDVDILSRLNKLTLSDLCNLRCICNKNLRKVLCFRNLRALKVQNCENLRFLFSSYMSEALEQIEEIEIANCILMEEIMDVQEEELEEVTTASTLAFPRLTKLKISGCPKMMTFFSSEGKQEWMTADTSLQQAFNCINSPLSLPIFFNQNVLFPSLEELKLFSCGLRRIWPSELPEDSFHKLASITVKECENLPHIFPSTLIERFQNLKMIEVVSCPSLEALIEHVGTSSSKVTSGFPSLTYVRLSHCHNLRYLFTYDIAMTLRKLEILDVSDCNNMQEVVSVEECEKPKLKTVKFSNLRTLKLRCLESLISFSSGSCAFEFPSLKEFIVEDCKAVKLIVGDAGCRKLEGKVPMLQPLLPIKKVKLPSMESMNISRMDSMEKIWLDDLASIDFSKLKTLTVKNCEKLPFIFSSNAILEKFRNLEMLIVTNCSSLEVVFHITVCSVITFQLRKLVLKRLSNMKHVWSGLPQGDLTFGRLRCMMAIKCQSLESLFPSWVAKNMAQLEEINVSYCGLEEIIAEEDKDVGTNVGDIFFPRLTTLKLLQLPELRSFYKNSHTSKWPFLRTLRVRYCGKMRPFSFNCESQSGQGSTASENQPGLFSVGKVIPRLEHIKVEANEVVMMRDISLNGRELVVEDAGYGEATPWGVLTDMGLPLTALENLKRLCLIKLYPNLSIGFPSPTLFQSLTELIVEHSYGLVHLGTCSALTSLGHLNRLVLNDCAAMEDVVMDDGSIAQEISFPKLEELILDGLPNLKSFSPMNCAFIFPSLVRIKVKQCPELTIFCKGGLSTPKLGKVLLSDKDEEGHWEGDLNTSIQTLRRENHPR